VACGSRGKTGHRAQIELTIGRFIGRLVSGSAAPGFVNLIHLPMM